MEAVTAVPAAVETVTLPVPKVSPSMAEKPVREAVTSAFEVTVTFPIALMALIWAKMPLPDTWVVPPIAPFWMMAMSLPAVVDPWVSASMPVAPPSIVPVEAVVMAMPPPVLEA